MVQPATCYSASLANNLDATARHFTRIDVLCGIEQVAVMCIGVWCVVEQQALQAVDTMGN